MSENIAFCSSCPVPNCGMPLEAEERNGRIICSCATHGEMTLDKEKGIVGYFIRLD